MPHRVLVVEDDPDIAHLVELHLRDLPCDVDVAHDGASALDAAPARPYDAIVLGRVYTRAQLLDFVWGYSHEGYGHTENSHINRLRAKIERDPGDPRFVLTVWGVGYKFRDVENV